MSSTIETEQYHGFTLRAEYDPEPMNPREFDVSVGQMVCWHRRYILGDVQIQGPVDLDELLSEIVDEHEATIILPLYLLDHSGITMRTGSPIELDRVHAAINEGRSAFNSDPGGWDTSFVGVIFDTREGRDKTGVEVEHLRAALEAEVLEYTQYLEGDVLGWVVEASDGRVLDSCWGHYGASPDEMIGEAREAADHLLTCGECGGKGYLVGQTYGGDIPEGWTPVQTCDTCEQINDDIEAARKAVQDAGGGEVRFPLNADGVIPSGNDVVIRRVCGEPLYDGESSTTCTEPWGTEHDH